MQRFQLIQTGASRLTLRFETPPGDTRPATLGRIVTGLHAYLARQGLHHVEIVEDFEPPISDPVSGKLREIIGMRAPDHARRRSQRRT